VGEGPLGLEKFLGDAALLAIGENETNGRAEEGGTDGDPGKGKSIDGNGASHEQDKKGDHNRKAVGDGEITEAGDRLGDGIRIATRPGDGKENDSEVGKEEKKVSPSGGAKGGF